MKAFNGKSGDAWRLILRALLVGRRVVVTNLFCRRGVFVIWWRG